jgi:hypothetical protein
LNDFLIFGLSVLLGFLAWGSVSYSYIWPRVRDLPLPEASRPLLYLHLFRFSGASFLVAGVAGVGLPKDFASAGAYGDLIAVGLAWIALMLRNKGTGIIALWVFNLWGTVDLLFAFYKGIFEPAFHPSDLGATFYIPTVYVPLLLCTHFMFFLMLVRARLTIVST